MSDDLELTEPGTPDPDAGARRLTLIITQHLPAESDVTADLIADISRIAHQLHVTETSAVLSPDELAASLSTALDPSESPAHVFSIDQAAAFAARNVGEVTRAQALLDLAEILRNSADDPVAAPAELHLLPRQTPARRFPTRTQNFRSFVASLAAFAVSAVAASEFGDLDRAWLLIAVGIPFAAAAAMRQSIDVDDDDTRPEIDRHETVDMLEVEADAACAVGDFTRAVPIWKRLADANANPRCVYVSGYLHTHLALACNNWNANALIADRHLELLSQRGSAYEARATLLRLILRASRGELDGRITSAHVVDKVPMRSEAERRAAAGLEDMVVDAAQIATWVRSQRKGALHQAREKARRSLGRYVDFETADGSSLPIIPWAGDISVETVSRPRRKVPQLEPLPQLDCPRDFFERTADKLLRIGIHPIAFSLLTLALTIGVSALVAGGYLMVAGIFFAVELCLETVDGLVAQRARRNARLYLFVDYVVDRAGDFTIAAGFAVLFWNDFSRSSFLLTVTAGYVFGSLMSTYVRSEAARLGLDGLGGFIERRERHLVLLVGMLIGAPSYAIILAALFALWTTAGRLRRLLWTTADDSIAPVLDFTMNYRIADPSITRIHGTP